MGIFSRFKDIVSANITSMLDKAEDPEKMIRLIISEMEETLIELKASCAGIMADRKRCEREESRLMAEVEKWSGRARLALEKQREDLAKEALIEKSRSQQALQQLHQELAGFDSIVTQTQADIIRLEEKIDSAKEKQRLLVQRHLRATQKIKAEKKMRQASSLDTTIRFDQYEQRIDQMEAQADLINPHARLAASTPLEDEFTKLENGDSIERELQQLKAVVEADKENRGDQRKFQ
ncbi:MAG: phage shock protein PspA [Chitinivibrionales bacterium]|nr:phage shock protein PspA [Chitinivibrionales bacterium]